MGVCGTSTYEFRLSDTIQFITPTFPPAPHPGDNLALSAVTGSVQHYSFLFFFFVDVILHAKFYIRQHRGGEGGVQPLGIYYLLQEETCRNSPQQAAQRDRLSS